MHEEGPRDVHESFRQAIAAAHEANVEAMKANAEAITACQDAIRVTDLYLDGCLGPLLVVFACFLIALLIGVVFMALR